MNHNHELDWFYGSTAWKHCRDTYMRSKRGLCEKCLAEGIITPATRVHHKTHLTPENVHDPNIALCFDNLEALCEKHHAAEHADLYTHREKRWRVNGAGMVTAADSRIPPLKNFNDRRA